jgi:acyl carrier protein
MDEIESRVQAVFQRVFRNKSLQLRPEMTAFDIQGWTSLSHVQLVVGLEKDFKIKFHTTEVVKMKSVGDVLGAVRSKLARA